MPGSIGFAKWVFVLLVCCALLPACKNERAVGANGTTEQPSIEIISPLTNVEWTGDELVVEVEVKNFVLDEEAIGEFSVPGRGHYHLIIDGDKAGVSAMDTVSVRGVSQGPHHVTVLLANNDHSTVEPTVEDSIIINVVAAQYGNSSEPNSLLDSSDDEPEQGELEEEKNLAEANPSPHFVSSTPSHGEALYEVPESIFIQFDFDLAPESSIDVTLDGKPIEAGEVVIGTDGMSMSASLEDSGTGIYQVSYKACWPYLNCHSGHFAFIVEPPNMDYSEEGY